MLQSLCDTIQTKGVRYIAVKVWRLLEEAHRQALRGGIERDLAEELVALEPEWTPSLCGVAHAVRCQMGHGFDLCWLLNAKSGRCEENCAFCAQSRHHRAEVRSWGLVREDVMVEAAREAAAAGAHRFCIVTSGRSLPDGEFERVLSAVQRIRKTCPDIKIDCSLGMLDEARASALKKAGCSRYNHNLESSFSFYPRICTTHPHSLRVETAKTVKESGMELCCGGIIGMGEGWGDRLDLAYALAELKTDCIPINFLIPQKGTPLENARPVPVETGLKTLALFRLINPHATIKVAGGRERNLRDFQGMALVSGANGIIVGGYLTVGGRQLKSDVEMVEDAAGFVSR